MEMPVKVHRPAKVKPKVLLKVNLGCGQHKREGFTGVDLVKTEATDVVHDLLKFPWPFEDASVEEVFCSHFFEHVPGRLRFRWMDELWRIMVTGGKATIICPYAMSVRAIQDPTHEWPPIADASFLYFNAGWRKQNLLDHYPIKCDFDFSTGHGIDSPWATRSQDAREFGVRHYINVVSDIHVHLIKRPPDGNK